MNFWTSANDSLHYFAPDTPIISSVRPIIAGNNKNNGIQGGRRLQDYRGTGFFPPPLNALLDFEIKQRFA